MNDAYTKDYWGLAKHLAQNIWDYIRGQSGLKDIYNFRDLTNTPASRLPP
jgi:hypothetical protein